MAASFESRNEGKKSIAECLRGKQSGFDIYEVAGVEVLYERRERHEQTVHIQTTIRRNQQASRSHLGSLNPLDLDIIRNPSLNVL